ncbi:MAG: hypothetical protein Q8R00_00745 [Candidatus Nanoarchaeia archaeon]|nr:hypothetical protein [Candidatus Nanoarchaeia archaeon]
MPKKGSVKSAKKTHHKQDDNSELISALIQHDISLQKKTIELISSFNSLSGRIDKFLSVFEKAASRIERGEIEEPLAKKLEALIDQNKIIARGLVILEKYVREKTTIGFSSPKNLTGMSKPLEF